MSLRFLFGFLIVYVVDRYGLLYSKDFEKWMTMLVDLNARFVLFFVSKAEQYQVSVKYTYIAIGVTAALSLLIDWRIVYKMFFNTNKEEGSRSGSWHGFVLANWIASGIFTLSLIEVLSKYNLEGATCMGILVSKGEEKVALILAFLSLTYLVGFFYISLVVDVTHQPTIVVDDSEKSDKPSSLPISKSLSSFVPPIYYVGIVCLVFYTGNSFFIRSLCVVISMLFFGALHLSYRIKASNQQKQEKILQAASNKQNNDNDDKTEEKIAMATRKFEIPKGKLKENWWRQFFYDLFVYILPITCISIMFPFLRPLAYFLSLFTAFFMPVYNFLAIRFFLQPTKLEDPIAASKRLASYPNGGAYPHRGWFRLVDSCDLKIGQVKYIKALGRDLAVFRGHDSLVRCLDAHCIHLGANMGVGGKVVGNCLQCPFHEWEFGGDGTCTKIPYESKIPPKTKTRSYHICEYYGLVLVWYHEQDSEPEYYPPTHSKLDLGEMVPRLHVETCVNMHIVEFAENSADFKHFDPLHGKMTFPFSPIVIPGIIVNHRPGWKEGKGEESHMSWFLDDADLSLFGAHLPESAASAVITFIGPAGLVYFTFNTPIGSIILFQTHTPIEPLRLKTAFHAYADANMPRFLVWYIVGNWVAQWQNDISVWENKRFAAQPLLTKNDGPMQKQRRWFKQFYSSSAPHNSNHKKEEEDGEKLPNGIEI